MKNTLLTAAAVLSLSTPAAHADGFPQSAELQFSGTMGLPATMTFTRTGNRYKIVASTWIPLVADIRFESEGTVRGNELYTDRYRDIRNGKIYAEAQLEDGNIRFTGKDGTQQTEAAKGRTLDIFSLAWQLATNHAQIPDNLYVTNGKRAYQVKGMDNLGKTAYRIGKQKISLPSYRVRQKSSHITYAFLAKANDLPAVIAYEDDGKSYRLTLVKAVVNGKELSL